MSQKWSISLYWSKTALPHSRSRWRQLGILLDLALFILLFVFSSVFLPSFFISIFLFYFQLLCFSTFIILLIIFRFLLPDPAVKVLKGPTCIYQAFPSPWLNWTWNKCSPIVAKSLHQEYSMTKIQVHEKKWMQGKNWGPRKFLKGGYRMQTKVTVFWFNFQFLFILSHVFT